MNRRSLLTSTAALGLTQLLVVGGCAMPANARRNAATAALTPNANSTRWVVSPAVGLDACFALAIAAADPSVLQVKEHIHRREGLRAQLGPDGVAAAERVMKAMAATGQAATPGPALALVVSAGQIETVGQVVETFSTDGILERGLEGTGFFQSERAKANLQRLRPVVATAFEALNQSGFEDSWRSEELPKLNDASRRLAEELAGVDMIAQHRRYLTRSLDAEVTVYLSELSEPHGIRIIGQRFVTSPNYSSLIARQNAAHEIIHRLFEPQRPESQRVLDRLANDPLLLTIAEKADPAFGYTSTRGSNRGLIEEGGVQALEAVINERLEQGRDQAEYWREHDGGMHIFAAATYALMHKSGFAAEGGDMLSWLDEQTAAGKLQGASLESLAAEIVGPEAVRRWQEQ